MKVSYPKQSRLTKLGLITSSILVAFQMLNWPILKLWNIYGGGNFIDLHLVLEFSKCFKESDIDIYSPASPCPGYIYGKPLLYIFSLFGDSYSVTKLIGFIFLFVISFTLAGIFNADSWRKQLLSISVMLSPPMLLLIERGNIDSLIFLSVFCSAIFWSRNFHLFSLI